MKISKEGIEKCFQIATRLAHKGRVERMMHPFYERCLAVAKTYDPDMFGSVTFTNYEVGEYSIRNHWYRHWLETKQLPEGV